MLLLFIAVGIGMFLFGAAGTWGPYKESLRENGDPRFFLAMMAFGTVFALVALRMLQIVFNSARVPDDFVEELFKNFEILFGYRCAI